MGHREGALHNATHVEWQAWKSDGHGALQTQSLCHLGSSPGEAHMN